MSQQLEAWNSVLRLGQMARTVSRSSSLGTGTALDLQSLQQVQPPLPQPAPRVYLHPHQSNPESTRNVRNIPRLSPETPASLPPSFIAGTQSLVAEARIAVQNSGPTNIIASVRLTVQLLQQLLLQAQLGGHPFANPIRRRPAMYEIC